MDTDEVVHSGPFVVHVDKAVISKVMLSSWSPKHELLAVVFMDKPMSLYRLNWERLWTVSPDTVPSGISISALCWSPDGLLLTVGLSSGSIVLLNVENASVVHRYAQTSSVLIGAHPNTSFLLTISGPSGNDLSLVIKWIATTGLEIQTYVHYATMLDSTS